MNYVAKVTLDVVLKNEKEAFQLLHKSYEDELEDVTMCVNSREENDCFNLTVNEINATIDGELVELYRNSTLNFQYIKTSQNNLSIGDALFIEGEIYNLMGCGDCYSLYSTNLRSYLKGFDKIQSIEEISLKLKDNNVEYQIYKRV